MHENGSQSFTVAVLLSICGFLLVAILYAYRAWQSNESPWQQVLGRISNVSYHKAEKVPTVEDDVLEGDPYHASNAVEDNVVEDDPSRASNTITKGSDQALLVHACD